MATRRTTAKAAAAPKAAPLQPEDLARFLGLKSGQYKAEQLSGILAAAIGQADQQIGEGASGMAGNHLYKQGVLHLAALFYAQGRTELAEGEQIPAVVRYFFELVRRELSGSAQ